MDVAPELGVDRCTHDCCADHRCSNHGSTANSHYSQARPEDRSTVD